jgi:RecA-family ATPase
MNDIFIADQAEDILADPIYQIPPRKLFGNFFYENEIALLLGDTNVGKTALAYDITFAVDNGYNYWREPMCEVPGEKNIVFYDLENSKRQFAARYVHKGFTLKNLTRVEFDQRNINLLSRDCFLEDVENRINDQVPNLFVIDNLSYLFNNNASAKESIEFMKRLKSLKETNPSVSILIIAHTKKRNMGRTIDQNDLYGSKFLMNFVDSAFGLGASVIDSSTRYLKQIKTRSSEKYSQVAELEIEGEPYLHFELVKWTPECNHMKQGRSRETVITDAIAEQIVELTNDGFSIREIASTLDVSKSSVHRFLREKSVD